MTTDDLIHSLIADEDSLLSLAWTRDGKTLVTASSDGSIRFRDSNLDLKGVIDGQPDWVGALDVSPDGRWLAAGRYNGSLSLYDTTSYKESRTTMVFDALKPVGILQCEGGCRAMNNNCRIGWVALVLALPHSCLFLRTDYSADGFKHRACGDAARHYGHLCCRRKKSCRRHRGGL